MSNSQETIVALATPPGRGGIAVVRVSGPQVKFIAEKILKKIPAPRTALYGQFFAAENEIIDIGIALYFAAPNSFTGEDVLELHGHGGPMIVDRLIKCIQDLGARLARPGEFSERAFLNDKIDLAQAEAIADLIDATSEQAARSAMRSLQGEFSQKINQLVEALIHLRMYVEAAIDFPEEEIDFLSDGKVANELQIILSQFETIKSCAQQGALLRDGMTVVIAGKPNAGKSSLLNQLSGKNSAIVTAIPGTTRDVVREQIQIDGLPVHIVDTAGLHQSKDIVEQEGISRAQAEVAKADRILLVIDASENTDETLAELLENFVAEYKNKITLIFNKIDLIKQQKTIENGLYPKIFLSAKTGEGIDLLREHLKKCVGYQTSESNFIARRRHLDALNKAHQHLLQGQDQLLTHRAGELLAEELYQAQNALSEITGEFRNDELLGRIFSSFCIGK